MPSCIIDGCVYRKSARIAAETGCKYRAFTLPKNPELRTLWLKKINLHSSEVTDSTVVCWRHFEEDAYVAIEDNVTTRGGIKRKRSLKDLSYPTLHLRPEKMAKKRTTENSSNPKPKIDRPKNVIEILFEKRKKQAPQMEQQAAEEAAIEIVHRENPPDVQSTIPHDHTYQKDITKKVVI